MSQMIIDLSELDAWADQVDRASRDLVSIASEVHELAGGRLDQPERLHKELLRNTVEVVTGICDTVGEAVTDLRESRCVVHDAHMEVP